MSCLVKPVFVTSVMKLVGIMFIFGENAIIVYFIVNCRQSIVMVPVR